jgi:hypothetical protein
MEKELTPEEVERRAREVARTFMSTPYRKQDWKTEREIKDQAIRNDVSRREKPDPSASKS